jgi:competence protein ComEA
MLGFGSQVLAATTVNVNTADAATLAKVLDGVGRAKAQAIVAYRKANGPFRSADDLTLVKGIGEVTVAQNRDHITVGDAALDGKASDGK